MAKKSGKSRGSRNSGKSEKSDRSNKIDLSKDEGSDIDLRKNDDIQVDDKESESSDNFGSLSHEIELYGDDEGNTVSGVVGVDIVPLGLNISANGDIGTVGIDIGLPGNVIGIGGSLNVNLETGEIVGGSGNISYGGASVEVDVRKQDGETCTAITITYFGIGVSYQRCKKEDEDDEKEPPKAPPPEPPKPGDPPGPPPPYIPLNPEGPWDDNDVGIYLISWSGYGSYISSDGHGYTGQDTIDIKSYSFNQPYGSRSSHIEGRLLNEKYLFYLSWQGARITNKSYRENNIIKWGAWSFPANQLFIELKPGDRSTNFKLGNTFSETGANFTIGFAPYGYMLFGLDKWINVKNYIINNQYSNTRNYSADADGISAVSYSHRYVTSFTFLTDRKSLTYPPISEPPIPPEDDVKECCNLEPIMSLLRKVSTAIGTDQLPAMMPKSFLKNEGFRKIPSLAELSVYHIEIMDQLIGKFPIELEIVDTDPLTPGDQTKKVILTNLAESIAELFGLAINSASDSAIQTSGSIKNLLEITLVRQAVLQNYYRLDAILDYLGAGLEEDEATFNSTISLPKDPNNISEDVAEFLQQSEIKFVIDKLADPKNTLTAKLLPIQKAADIIKAKYWKGFGKAGGDYIGAIKNWLETYDPKSEQNDTEWKDKIDKILEEYAKDATGNIDKDRLPKIQNITQIGSEPIPPQAPPGVK